MDPVLTLPPESQPRNQGLILWPTPSQGPREAHYPSRCHDYTTARGWFDDGQGGMAVLLVFPDPPLPTMRDLWGQKAPMVFSDHFLDLPYDTVHTRSRAIIPIAVSDWCWCFYDGEGGCSPFQARYTDLTPDGVQLVTLLSNLYGRMPEIVTHVDT